jgi:hypothetical protein
MAETRSEILSELRRRAEHNLSRIVMKSVPSLASETIEDSVHELQVHQIELELQCQELQRTQVEIEESWDRYRELYESLPIGYATTDVAGRIPRKLHEPLLDD